MPITRTFAVSGMTCDRCVSAVTRELRALDGVTDVAVTLNPAGDSIATVTSTAPVSDEQVAAALDEAGDYRLVSA
jgi:copper chaperone